MLLFNRSGARFEPGVSVGTQATAISDLDGDGDLDVLTVDGLMVNDGLGKLTQTSILRGAFSGDLGCR